MRHDNRTSRSTLFAQNFLWIGDRAWQGYLNGDRGVVAISSQVDIFDGTDALVGNRRSPSLNFRYIPQSQLTIYLQEWLVPSQSMADIATAVANYQPHTELIFAAESGDRLDIGWCQNLKISPPDCHQQLWRRTSEFELGFRD
jgi:hypothetical protein